MNNCSASCGQCVSSGNNRDVNIGAGGSGAGAGGSGAGGTKKDKTPKSPSLSPSPTKVSKSKKSKSPSLSPSPTKVSKSKKSKSPSLSPSPTKVSKSKNKKSPATTTTSASNGASLTETTSPTAVYVPPVATLVGLSAIGLAFLFWRRSRRSSAQEVPIAEATPMVVEKSDVVFPISSNSMGNEFEVNGI